jgi:hypothetical protein
MSANAKETKYIKNQVTDEERCLFTTNHGNRCRNPHLGNATRHCFLHEGRNQKADEAEVAAVAEQLLNKNVELVTRDDVNRIMSQLYTMLVEKRVSRQDGSLLAYIASVMLQSITPVRRKAIAAAREEFVESVAEPIRNDVADRAEFRRRLAERFPQGPPQMPGRTDNPYMYPTKLK